ncbi:MAG TPA: tetratricopeptide repeat protein [Thermoanaerobaculia bacterium]|nr:tetratricopeptide repeat protein [Thermoanaerobaculia bacterium]
MKPTRAPETAWLRVLVAASLLAAGAWAGGCRTAGPSIAIGSDLTRSIRSRGLDPNTVVVPWELTSEMRSWAHKAVPGSTPAGGRLELLLGKILASDGLKLEYQAGVTGTAQDVFASHRANCMSFTSLFVGMARELEVPVFYLDVGDLERYEKEGNLVVESGHVTAGYGTGSMLRILEFAPQGKVSYRQLHPLGDLTAIALFYSNRGAELLRAGKQDEALLWLRQSVQLDPGLARARINFGVVLRRSGDLAGAEAAYRKALEIDPNAVAAYQDLAALLFASGRGREGDELLALTAKLDSRNPFNLLALGDVSLAHGRLEEARRYYRQAQRLDGKMAESYAALGEVALAAGDARQARRWLKKAIAVDGANDRVRRLSGKVGAAGQPAAGGGPAAGSAAAAPAGPAAGSGPAGGSGLAAGPADSPAAAPAVSPAAAPAGGAGPALVRMPALATIF